MNVLKKISFLEIDKLAPGGLSSKDYNYELSWMKVNITFSEDDIENTHAFILRCIDLRDNKHEVIGYFMFVKNKYKGYNYSLAKYEVNSNFFPDKVQRYFNLFLPVHSSFVLKLKDEQINQ